MKIKVNKIELADGQSGTGGAYLVNNENSENLHAVRPFIIDLEGATPQVELATGVDGQKSFSFGVKMEDGTYSAVILPYQTNQVLAKNEIFGKYFNEAEANFLLDLTKAAGDPDFINNNLMSEQAAKRSELNWRAANEPTDANFNNSTSRVFFANAPEKIVQIAEAIAGGYDIDFTGQQKITFESAMNQNAFKNSKAQQKVANVLANNPSIAGNIEILRLPTQRTTVANYTNTGLNDFGAFDAKGGVSQVVFNNPTLGTGLSSMDDVQQAVEDVLSKLDDTMTQAIEEYLNEFNP